MLVFDREAWPGQRIWAWASALTAVAATAWCVATAMSESPWRWPSGSSLPGFTLGVVGGAIIIFEMLLWPRKLLRGWRLGRTKCWMAGHLWLGWLCLPLLLLHGGFHFNPARSTLAAVLMWLLVLVVVSGIWGLVMQHLWPRRMLHELPAETIHGQIGHVLGQYREQARRVVEQTCGGLAEGSSEVAEPMLVSASTRQSGSVQGKSVESIRIASSVAETEPLREFFDERIAPYLQETASGSPLDSASRSAELFDELKRRIPVEAHPAVAVLADLCDQRRQFALQARWHRRLHAWLGVHFALSLALTLLMIAHIVLALKYL